MRIQHNIMAMSAYRNYTNNVSAMKGNLEKLSSGYKINRAGDDAAGLAISEKMRAQITGLKQAQANAKSGINLVQTAEGALQEVQDMMNRMVKLAEQSANGTYDVNVDRKQLQKEFEQLKDEINRINQGSNFNGIYLFGGPEDTAKTSDNGGIETYETTTIKMPAVTATTGEAVGNKDATAETLTFAVSFKADNAAAEPTWGASDTVVVKTAGKDGSNALTLTATAAVTDGKTTWTVSGQSSDYTATFDGTTMTMTKNAPGATTLTKEDYGAVTVEVTNAADTEGKLSATGDVTVTAGAAAVTDKPGTASKVEVDFDGLTGKDVLGDTVTIGDKTYEFVKTGEDVKTTGAVKVEVGESDAAAALATAFETAVKGSKPTGTDDPAVSGTKVTVSNTAKGATELVGEATDAAGGDKKPTKVETVSADVTAASVDFKDDSTKLTDQAMKEIKGLGEITVDGTFKVDLSELDLSTNDTGKTAAAKILKAAQDAAKAWNTANGDKEKYTYEKVRLADKDGNPIAVQAAGDKITILADKTPKSDGADPVRTINIQIGDTSASYNRMEINIYSISSSSIKDISEGTTNDDGDPTTLDDLSVATESDAAAALSSLKGMVNYISDIRGELGAKQNRLTHTINNLSVMEENIQDAESTIRDTDVADEMMAYTKNNILIQSAQAMLAQANQVPQGVLQLLQ